MKILFIIFKFKILSKKEKKPSDRRNRDRETWSRYPRFPEPAGYDTAAGS